MFSNPCLPLPFKSSNKSCFRDSYYVVKKVSQEKAFLLEGSTFGVGGGKSKLPPCPPDSAHRLIDISVMSHISTMYEFSILGMDNG